MPQTPAGVQRFTSTRHPQGAPAALVYGRAIAVPLGACMLPVMLGALAAALQSVSLTPFLLWGAPAALLVASLWTRFHLMRTPAEILVRPDAAAVRSIYDCAHRRGTVWKRVFDLRTTRRSLEVAIGRDAYELAHAEWPEHEALLEALREARYAPAASS